VDEKKPKLFKDHYNRAAVGVLAKEFKKAYPAFIPDRFLKRIFTEEFAQSELKQRMRLIATALKPELPAQYARAVTILIRVAPQVGGFENWVLTAYVELFGLDHFDHSIRAIHALTQHGTAEFTIRPFINRNPSAMLLVLEKWALDKNEHVRRLVAEGTRPRGVWCEHIIAFRKDPAPVIALLERLKADPSLYVRKAVANNLNDISRDNPDIALKTAKEWMQLGNPHTNWIVKRACRSLIKSGRPEVFPIFGYTANPKVTVESLHADKRRITIGGSAVVEFNLVSGSQKKQKLVIDYSVSYVSKLGKTTRKVFKCTEKTLGAFETLPLFFRHKFENNSTRTHYQGQHRIEILVNGINLGSVTITIG
jgi:3-methyladenine DNA glycosylase AlkC